MIIIAILAAALNALRHHFYCQKAVTRKTFLLLIFKDILHFSMPHAQKA